jgi:hypothetical protein
MKKSTKKASKKQAATSQPKKAKTNATVATERADAAKATTKAKAASQDAPAANDAQQARPDSKKARVLDLIRRPEGASVKEIMAATGWLAHSVRGFVSGGLVKKMALKIESIKRESGDRAYHLAN